MVLCIFHGKCRRLANASIDSKCFVQFHFMKTIHLNHHRYHTYTQTMSAKSIHAITHKLDTLFLSITSYTHLKFTFVKPL